MKSAEESYKNTIEAKRSKIETMILSAVAKGEYSIYIEDLPSEIQDELTENNYTITEHLYNNYTVSWDKAK